MNKIELVTRITEESTEEVNRKQVCVILEALESVVRKAVISGDKVTIPGICKVTQKEVKERTGIIRMGIRKGDTYLIPAHKEGSVKIAPPLKNVFER